MEGDLRFTIQHARVTRSILSQVVWKTNHLLGCYNCAKVVDQLRRQWLPTEGISCQELSKSRLKLGLIDTCWKLSNISFRLMGHLRHKKALRQYWKQVNVIWLIDLAKVATTISLGCMKGQATVSCKWFTKCVSDQSEILLDDSEMSDLSSVNKDVANGCDYSLEVLLLNRRTKENQFVLDCHVRRMAECLRE